MYRTSLKTKLHQLKITLALLPVILSSCENKTNLVIKDSSGNIDIENYTKNTPSKDIQVSSEIPQTGFCVSVEALDETHYITTEYYNGKKHGSSKLYNGSELIATLSSTRGQQYGDPHILNPNDPYLAYFIWQDIAYPDYLQGQKSQTNTRSEFDGGNYAINISISGNGSVPFPIYTETKDYTINLHPEKITRSSMAPVFHLNVSSSKSIDPSHFNEKYADALQKYKKINEQLGTQQESCSLKISHDVRNRKDFTIENLNSRAPIRVNFSKNKVRVGIKIYDMDQNGNLSRKGVPLSSNINSSFEK